MLLCRHSYLSRASLQLLRRWPRVQGEMLQRGHLMSTTFFHLAKLSGLARQFVEALAIRWIFVVPNREQRHICPRASSLFSCTSFNTYHGHWLLCTFTVGDSLLLVMDMTDQGRLGRTRVDQDRWGKTMEDQGRSGHTKTDQGRSGQSRVTWPTWIYLRKGQFRIFAMFIVFLIYVWISYDRRVLCH